MGLQRKEYTVSIKRTHVAPLASVQTISVLFIIPALCYVHALVFIDLFV